MKAIGGAFFLVFVLSLAATALPQAALPDDAPAALAARAGKTPDAAPGGLLRGDPGAGNELFYSTGPDNGVCVRAIADVNGDGIDDIIAGIDESQVDNVFCLSGASSGTATVLWKFMTNDGVSGGAPYGDQCIVPISDPDGNGYQNFLLGTAWGGRTAYCVDSFDGSIIWKFDTYLTADSGWVYSLCELNDITGDGIPECAFGAGSYNDSVYLVDGASTGAATVIWTYYAGDAIYSVRDIGDVNGDGKHDVLAAIGDSVAKVVCLDGGTANPSGHVLWTYSPGINVYACGVLPDVTGDGIDEALAVLWTMTGTAIRCVNGATGALHWASAGIQDYGMMVDIIEDVSGDGFDDIIVSSWDNEVVVLDGAEGAVVWRTEVGTLNGGDVWTARAIDDVNRDGRQDVIAGSFDTNVYLLDGDSGEIYWAFDTDNRLYSVAPAGDLDGDGRPDVASATQDTSNNRVVHVLEGDADIPFPNLTLDGTGALGSPLAIEITGLPNWTVILGTSESTGMTPWPPFLGYLGLGAPIIQLPNGTCGPDGLFLRTMTIPTNPAYAGRTFYFQGLVMWPAPLYGGFSDVESIALY